MSNAAKWIIRIGAVLVGTILYGVWRQIEREVGLGMLSAFARGAVVFGGLAWVWSITRTGANRQSSPVSTAGLRPCPYCAEAIRPAARLCRFCNRDVTPIPMATESARAHASNLQIRRAGLIGLALALIGVVLTLTWMSRATEPTSPIPMSSAAAEPTRSVGLETRPLTEAEQSALAIGNWQIADGFLIADVQNRNPYLDVTELRIVVAGRNLTLPVLLLARERGSISSEIGKDYRDGSPWKIVGAMGNDSVLNPPPRRSKAWTASEPGAGDREL